MAVLDLLSDVATGAALLLVVEDAHWVDRADRGRLGVRRAADRVLPEVPRGARRRRKEQRVINRDGVLRGTAGSGKPGDSISISPATVGAERTR